LNEDIERIIVRRKEKWKSFLDMNGETRCVFIVDYDENPPERPWPNPEGVQERIEWAWDHYRRHLERMKWLDDDSVPALHVYTGTEIFAECFGCKVYVSDDNMPFALPAIKRASEVAALEVPDVGAEPLAMLFGIADELRRRAGDAALLKIPDIQSPMDIAALIWDKTAFFTAMIESPEAVKELADKAKRLLVAFLDEWFARYGSEFLAHYPDYYMPFGITLSEDEVGSVNEEMFREFFLPELVELSRRYGRMGLHCCAAARHQWENFKRIPNLCLLNLVQPEEELRRAYDFFARHTTQMHSWCGDDDPLSWLERLPQGSHVVLRVDAETREEAARLAGKLRRRCG